MTPVLAQQQKLLAEKLQVLRRLEDGLHWSLERLPELHAGNIGEPDVTERAAAIVERFCKLQDQLAGSLRHAHTMLGEKQRSFHDVVIWAVSQHILANETAWLELRSLRNRLTHEYDLASDALPELIALIRQFTATLSGAINAFVDLCRRRHLADVPQNLDTNAG